MEFFGIIKLYQLTFSNSISPIIESRDAIFSCNLTKRYVFI